MDVYKVGSDWVFASGKHQGKTLREVGLQDPGYLPFVYWKQALYWRDEAVWALQDVMNGLGIDYRGQETHPQ